ncbi:TolC family protein [Bradyrhizobium sp. WSM3983]|uniref:TolC family protein n=1 Tax=Bradyrhizobium sp. WSM3983 TaxID=1038867 RepID=UPI00041828DA|nr:TolC family protein [Bradyrhizobium sp. WSM3983]
MAQYFARGAHVLALLGLSGCAAFSPDSGMTAVSALTSQTLNKDVAFVRTAEGAGAVEARVRQLLSGTLSAETAVQVALLNNKGLQAAYNELALAETDLVEQSLPSNPVFSVSRISGNGASEIERQVVGDILALATLPFRSDIARERFRQAQLRAALATLRLAADVRRAYVRAVAGNEMVVLLTDAKATAESTAKLAVKLGETGSVNKLDQAREQVFYAETTADLATARQATTSAREKLTRLMGLWDDGLDFRLPNALPPIPRRPQALPSIEADAVEHRIDLQIARLELAALAKSLNLTEATRFVTLLDLAGISRRTQDPEGAPFRERGFDVQFQIPIFDGGEVRVRQAAETYNLAFNRLTERAVNVRSEARDAYRVYRATYDIAIHYHREILPLRKIITEEMQLRFSSMQVDIFALLAEARQRLASLRGAIDAKQNFFLAQSALQTAVNGGGAPATDSDNPTNIVAAAPADGGH